MWSGSGVHRFRVSIRKEKCYFNFKLSIGVVIDFCVEAPYLESLVMIRDVSAKNFFLRDSTNFACDYAIKHKFGVIRENIYMIYNIFLRNSIILFFFK